MCTHEALQDHKVVSVKKQVKFTKNCVIYIVGQLYHIQIRLNANLMLGKLGHQTRP